MNFEKEWEKLKVGCGIRTVSVKASADYADGRDRYKTEGKDRNVSVHIWIEGLH